jgi:hypothetical protein
MGFQNLTGLLMQNGNCRVSVLLLGEGGHLKAFHWSTQLQQSE